MAECRRIESTEHTLAVDSCVLDVNEFDLWSPAANFGCWHGNMAVFIFQQSFYTNYKTLENSCCVLCPWKQRWSAQYRYENFVRERACYIAYYVSVTNFHRIITRCIPPNISPLTFPTVAHNITFYEMIRALLILHKESFGSMIEKNIASRVTIGDHLMRTTVLSIIHV